ncbi:hypothetical protein COB21_04730 [Candidatus Aerophobetes bacterium]|uniref:Aromatic amino acid permease n=1 Tax=Aerophobetes bacterium TaxID=2030807 RepID=A0A2A4X253_UNCAE|nr:MAG: hypothetical protein COB21_04730 [Candidatus Aerophobetes bacterium]
MRFTRFFSGSCLVAGTMIGAGMLGIPLVTSSAGVVGAFLSTFVVWIFMLITGLLYLEATLALKDGVHVLSITEHFLGKWGKWVSGFFFIFLYFSLMVAYFDAGGALFAKTFFGVVADNVSIVHISLFALIFFIIVGIGPRSIDRVNMIISSAMIIAFIFLMVEGMPKLGVNTAAKTFHGGATLLSLPILFAAYGFHNIIPSLSSYLKRDKKLLKRCIFVGSFVAFIVYFLWQWIIISTVPMDIITAALHENISVTETFSKVHQMPLFALIGRFFALFAITTSLLGVSFSLVDFLADGMGVSVEERKGVKRWGLAAIVFFLPLLFVWKYPDVFIAALGVAGGFGEAFLNGLLPVALVFVLRYKLKGQEAYSFITHWSFLLFLALMSLGVMVIEYGVLKNHLL